GLVAREAHLDPGRPPADDQMAPSATDRMEAVGRTGVPFGRWRALAGTHAAAPAALGGRSPRAATAHDRRWAGPAFVISVAAASGEGVGAQSNQGRRGAAVPPARWAGGAAVGRVEWGALPTRIAARSDLPREPITIRPASRSSARSQITRAAWP